MIKLIAIDVDGTLTRTDGSISQRTIDALVTAQQCGVRLCIASGRPPYGCRHIASLLRVDEYGGFVIGFNGGELLDLSTGVTLFSRPLSREVLPYAVELGRMTDNALITYVGDKVYTERPQHRYVILSASRNRMQVCGVENFISDIHGPMGKCLLAGDSSVIERLETEARERIGNVADCFRSDPFYLEIVAKGTDKSNALSGLLELLNLDSSQLMACGDGYNDLGMVRMAGVGVAMGNADEKIREAADVVAQHTNEDGLARVIENLVLGL